MGFFKDIFGQYTTGEVPEWLGNPRWQYCYRCEISHWNHEKCEDLRKDAKTEIIRNSFVPPGPRPPASPAKTEKDIDNKTKSVHTNSMMKTTEMLDKAISITAQAFLGREDKGGVPYILHCLHVMNDIRKKFSKDWELQAIAVLHDLVEDTDWTVEKLRDEGFSQRIVRGVELLTHDPSVPYDDYIKHIGMYEDARQIKLVDLRHNSDIMRIKGLTKRDLDRMEKYQRSYHYLNKV